MLVPSFNHQIQKLPTTKTTPSALELRIEQNAHTMNVPKFNEREKALEDDYIRRKEYVPSFLRHIELEFPTRGQSHCFGQTAD